MSSEPAEPGLHVFFCNEKPSDDIHFIFSREGGEEAPMVMGRLHDYPPKTIAEVAPNGIDYELARLYYDIAGTAIAALTKLVPVTQILFGSDNPFLPLKEAARRMKALGLSPAELRATGRTGRCAPAKLASYVAHGRRVARIFTTRSQESVFCGCPYR
jgi:hypothetical protein